MNRFLNDICDIFTVQNTIDNMMLGDPWDVELMENRTIRVRILFILLYCAFCPYFVISSSCWVLSGETQIPILWSFYFYPYRDSNTQFKSYFILIL
jgi:hypothetical protein